MQDTVAKHVRVIHVDPRVFEERLDDDHVADLGSQEDRVLLEHVVLVRVQAALQQLVDHALTSIGGGCVHEGVFEG